ncbi:MAG: carbon-nitrogen hydrolase family protein [Pseudomonadota bacterium]
MTDRSTPFSAGAMRLAILQVAPIWLDAWATWDKLKSMARKAVTDGAEVLCWGESLVPGYPNWTTVDDTERQQSLYARYWDNAATLDGALVADMCAFARSHRVMLIGGVAERGAGSVYCTVLTIGTDGAVLGRHRKLKPTWRERLVWADGDGLGLKVHDTKIGKIGALNCWENWLPLARAALHQKGEFVHVAVWPGSDALVRDVTPFIALEGRSWSVAACGLLRSSDMAHLTEDEVSFREEMLGLKDVWQDGGSRIIAPSGEVVAGPLIDAEGIIAADLSARDVVEARQNLDSSGHYSRPDVLQLRVRGPNEIGLA